MIVRLTTTLNVRATPSARGEDIGDAESGSEFAVLRRSGDWFEVAWGDGKAYLSAHPKYHRVVDAAHEAAVLAAKEGVEVSAGEDVLWEPAEAQSVLPVLRRTRAWPPLSLDVLDGTARPALAIEGTPAAIGAAILGGTVRTPEQFAVMDRAARVLGEDARENAMEALSIVTPYFSQRDNDAREGGSLLETKGGRMCNLTSLAMALVRQGIRVSERGTLVQPEDRLEAIRVEQGFGPRTTWEGWGRLAQHLGCKQRWLLGAPGTCPLSWWENGPRDHLRQGYSLVASITGHIVTVVGVRPDRILVHDPYGACTLGSGTAITWRATNPYDAAAGVSSGTVGRWLEHDAASLKDHRWNWVVAIRSKALEA